MNTAPCGFVAFRDDGTMIEVNQTLAEMLEYERVALAGWHIEKIFPPGGRIFYHTYLFPMLKVQGRVDEIYAALRTAAGNDLPVLLNGVRREREGQFVSECVCVRMIQRHAYEDQLLQARRLAEESGAAKAKFLSMMSHDLRTPLAAIDGNAQVLESGMAGSLNDEQLDAVRGIREAAHVQLTLMNDILEFAQLESGRVQVHATTVPVAEIVQRATALVRHQMREAGLTLRTEECDANTHAVADADRLQQILLNLLTNAVKFPSRGGEITVTGEAAGERVRIHVRDTGIGIAANQLQRIFSPFVQVEPSLAGPAGARGVGLGLAISRDLARAMSGDVTAQSTPGEGSTFTIDLPAGAPVPA